MSSQEDNLYSPLAFARNPERQPVRQTLRLADGYETTVHLHRPPGGSSGLPVLYLHGIQSHPGWFVASAAAMAECGHAVFQVTRRGSGDNSRFRGHAESASRLLQDLQAACRHVLEQTSAKRVHLVGVSWGGKLAACHAARPGGSGQLASLTLVAPGIVPKVSLPGVKKLAVAACALLAPRRRFEIPLNEVELFTDNEQMRTYLRADAHRLLQVTARFLYVSRCLDVMLRKAEHGAIAVPTTLILASRDRIIDNDRTAAEVERLTAGRAVAEVLEGCHTLQFEQDPHLFLAAMLKAIERGEAAPASGLAGRAASRRH